jgi:molecular chaperone HscB
LDTAVHGRTLGSPPQGVKAGAEFRGDHFALFGLEPRFTLDTEALSGAWRRLQALVHPDRYAGGGDAQARVAMQWSTLVNTAYRTLLDPLARAGYLCELRGVPIDAERNTAMPVDFLDEQMQWREELDEAPAEPEARARATREAAAEVRVLMFIERFRRDLAPRVRRPEAS